MKIGEVDDKENSGRIHVDYAQARDDLYEWECNQRDLARENRHREMVEEDLLRPRSPPPITHFSDYEASVLLENLKGMRSRILNDVDRSVRRDQLNVLELMAVFLKMYFPLCLSVPTTDVFVFSSTFY